MFIPKDKRYIISAGPLGAVMCYCYCCCCGGRAFSKNDLIDPAPYVRLRNSLKQ